MTNQTIQIPVERLPHPFADAHLVLRGISLLRAKELIKIPELNIVLANVGFDFEIVDLTNRYGIFKNEISPRICTDLERIELSQYPGNYCYVLSEWLCKNGSFTLLAEVHH
ncbi:hypothetical protein L1F30_01075 [Simiduia sp. 21SJ11W-1]|uniref:hypothetical protein n=1 Tax=Simiduia sp. 21SJ11W-1 TaxID=2909669 RepID=UPI0020A0BE37|nr:hypothetical protein [Simiduia sp. 21SJ11W-1]UTA48148.1 hypothetical protein L1F30_01075 [Simiduia sp. 21SJ11W-1]